MIKILLEIGTDWTGRALLKGKDYGKDYGKDTIMVKIINRKVLLVRKVILRMVESIE